MGEELHVTGDVVYSHDGRDLLCDLYHPPPATENGAAVIALHGGGWRRGDRATMKDAATALASRGFLAIALGYRLIGEVSWPTPADDVKAAVRWARSNAAGLSIDPEAIALMGFSAGAHLALIAAGTALETDGVSKQAAAVAAFFPPTRLTAGSAKALDLADDQVAAASPIEYASSSFPPTLMLHGTGDTVVPYTSSVEMFDALSKAGATADLRLYAGLQHEFVWLPGYLDLCVADIALFFEAHVLQRERYGVARAELEQFWQQRRPAAVS